MIYTKLEDGFEFTKSASLNLGVICLVEILLLTAFIYCIAIIKSPERYIIAFALIFFALILALGIYPAIDAAKKSKNLPIWSANKKGIFIPSIRSSFTGYLPPLFTPWESMNKVFFAQMLVDCTISGEVTVSRYVIVVELKNKKRLFLSYPKYLEDELFSFFSLIVHCKNSTYKVEELKIN